MTTRTSLLESSAVALKRNAVKRVQPEKKTIEESSGEALGYRGKRMTRRTVKREAYIGYTGNIPTLRRCF